MEPLLFAYDDYIDKLKKFKENAVIGMSDLQKKSDLIIEENNSLRQ